MRKWVCTVCGYVYEDGNASEKCLQRGVPASKFREQEADKMAWTCEYEVGAAQGAPEDIMMDLRVNFEGECSRVGMYLTMSRVVHRGGYPGTGTYRAKAAFEEAKHAAKFVELLDEVVTPSTKENLEMRVTAGNGTTAGELNLAKKVKALNLDAIHDTIHEMVKDEARHSKVFEGLLNRYFG